MKIYISGALMGASDLEKARSLYEKFAEASELAGCEPYLPHRNTDPETTADLSDSIVMFQDIKELNDADAVIVYLGEPSLGAGAEIAIAMQNNKVILALYETGKPVSRFITGLLKSYPNSTIYSYNTIEEANLWIEKSLNFFRLNKNVASEQPANAFFQNAG